MSIESILKGNDLFGSLSIEEVDRISSISSLKQFKKGEVVFAHNRAGRHVYMLMDGSVSLQLPANPPEFSFTISKIQQGEMFGLSPLLGSSRYTCTARCPENAARVLSIEAEPFRDILRENCATGLSIANQVARIYFDRYINILKRLEDMVGQISLTH